jgi:hypothetical protein
VAARQWRAANLEMARQRQQERDRRRRAANPEAAREARRRQWAANPEAYRQRHRLAARRQRAVNPEPERERYRRYRRKLREVVFGHYGRVCACCGTTERLGIDHVNGDGRAHRRALGLKSGGQSTRFYAWLVRQGFPPGYQVLCAPCNGAKGNGPACPLEHGSCA